MASAFSLLDVLAEVPDPRSRHGQRHPLPAILSLAVLAMLSGCRGYQAISQFGRDHGMPLAIALGFRRGKTPAPSTFCEIFRALDVTAFEAALTRWIRSRLPEDADLVLCLDGKTLRGSKDGELPGHHLVAAYAPPLPGGVGSASRRCQNQRAQGSPATAGPVAAEARMPDHRRRHVLSA